MGDPEAIPSGPITGVSEASLRLLGVARGAEFPGAPGV